MEPINKGELIQLVEGDDSIQYLGTFEVGGEARAFYRTRIGAADEPRGYKLVYVVV